jgi:hypothetical protein
LVFLDLNWPLFTAYTMPMLSDLTTNQQPLCSGVMAANASARQRPSSTAMAAAAWAQPMLNSSFGPTCVELAQCQMAHLPCTNTPTPKDVLASPHQPIPSGSSFWSSMCCGGAVRMHCIHKRSHRTLEDGVHSAFWNSKFCAK